MQTIDPLDPSFARRRVAARRGQRAAGAAFGAELNVTAPDAAPAFLAAVLIEGLLLAPPGDARAALGRRLVDCHLIESDAAGLSTNAKAELLGLLEPRVLVQPDVERESLDRAAALKGLLKELRAALQAPLERFLSSAVIHA